MDNVTQDYQQMGDKYGTATLGDLTVALTEIARPYNQGTNPTRVCYYANAIDSHGNKYQVIWETTEEWNRSCEFADLDAQDDLSPEDAARLEELREMSMVDCGDEANACDWDKPLLIEAI